MKNNFFLSDELDLQIKCTDSPYLSIISVSSPQIVWQWSTCKPSSSFVSITSPCYHIVLPRAFLMFSLSSSAHVHRHRGPGYCLLIWCQALNITVLTLPHICQDLASQVCLAALPTTWPWSRYAGPTKNVDSCYSDDGGSMPIHKKHVPNVLFRQLLIMGHSPDVGNCCETCVSCSEMDSWYWTGISQKWRRIRTGDQIPQGQPLTVWDDIVSNPFGQALYRSLLQVCKKEKKLRHLLWALTQSVI